MEDFKKLPKMQSFKTGGSVQAKNMCYGGKMRKGGKVESEKEDIKQDKAIVKKAFAMHDKQEHEGEKTDLSKLRKGGRAKKAVGTVKKYKTGGTVETAYGAKKTDKDLKDIANSKRQKPQMLCGGKSVKKMADGGQPDPNDIGAGVLNAIGKVPVVGGALKRGATDMRDKVLGTPEQNRIARAQLDRIAARKAAEKAALMGGMGGAGALQQGALAGAAPAPAPVNPMGDATGAMPAAPMPAPVAQKRGGKAGKKCK